MFKKIANKNLLSDKKYCSAAYEIMTYFYPPVERRHALDAGEFNAIVYDIYQIIEKNLNPGEKEKHPS